MKKTKTQCLLKILFPFFLVCIFVFHNITPALAVNINYNRLIDNPIFDNYNTMSAAQIDAFLNTFSGSCISTNKGFKAPEPVGYNPTEGFIFGSNVSAGRVIYASAQAYEINPQVLLATLQKEQGLVTGSGGICSDPFSNTTRKRYAAAMGYGCPDGGTRYSYSGINLYTIGTTTVTSVSETCVNSSGKAGFSQQVIRAAWLLKYSRMRAEGKVTWAIIKPNWDNSDDLDNYYSGFMTQGTWQRCSSCSATFYDGYATIDGTAVHMDNGATASLYVYTPHKAGNSNFVNIFTIWFGSTLGSILFKIANGTTYYLEWGGFYFPIPSNELLKAYGLEKIAPRVLNNFPSDETAGPILTRVVKFGSDDPSAPDYTTTVTLVDAGKKHDAPNWTMLNAHGYTNYVNLPSSLRWLLKNGDDLRALIRQPDGAIFLMENNKKRLFPDWATFSTLSGPNYNGINQIYSQQSLTNLSSDYLSTKTEGPPMLLDGSFIKPSDGLAIYLYDNGKKYIFDPDTYLSWGRQLDYSLSSGSISQIINGGEAPILVKSSSDAKYLVDNGKRKVFSSTVQTDWGLNDTQFMQMTSRSLSRLAQTSVSNLVRSSNGTVYFISNGQLHGIPSLIDFNNSGFSWSNVDNISNKSLSLLSIGANQYAQGSLLREPNGTIYLTDTNYKAYGVTSLNQFNRFGFSWQSVRNVSNQALSGYTKSNLQNLLQNIGDSKYYVIENGLKHYIDSNAFSASQYNMSGWPFNQVDSKILSLIKSGPQLTRFIKGSSTTVYYIENGQRRGITSSAKFYSLGGSWSQVVYVSDDFLTEIPLGPII